MTADDWKVALFSPLWVFSVIAEADGTVDKKETAELLRVLQSAPLYDDPIIREVVGTIARDFGTVWPEYIADPRPIDVALDEVSSVLDNVLKPDRAKYFKMFLLFVARQIALASGGGLLGLGDKFSDEEKVAFMFVMAKLGVSTDDIQED